MEDAKLTNSPSANLPLSEEQIIATHVRKPKPLNSTIYLAPYNPVWPLLFTRLEKHIREVLGDSIRLLEHVGSTSVPGLSAKPIIDMVLAVKDSRDEPSYVKPLEEKGYILRIREPDWYEHRLLKPPDVPGNLHVFSEGCEQIEQMLLFRDWLRNHASDRLVYEETKRKWQPKPGSTPRTMRTLRPKSFRGYWHEPAATRFR